MDKLQLATTILGLLKDGIGAAVDAIRAGTEADEQKAFGVLFDVIDQTTALVAPLRAQITVNQAKAERDLADKFPQPEDGFPDPPTKP